MNAYASNTGFEPNQRYAGYTNKPVNYSQGLWHVNDNELSHPGERFIKDNSPYVDAIMEGGDGPLERAPIPEGLHLFCEHMVKFFGAIPTEYSDILDVTATFMMFLDYTEPYFLFVDMPVALTANQLKFTYRTKDKGRVLPPEEIECFTVVNGWDYKPYRAAVQFLEHPQVKAVLKGENVYHPASNIKMTKMHVLEKLAKIVYGSEALLKSHVEDMLYRHYENIPTVKMDDLTIRSMDSLRERDKFFWLVTTVAALMWFKSEYALKYLIEYHPIYNSMLSIDPKTKQPMIAEGSGGLGVVWHWDIYTEVHLYAEEGSPPGTCECCKQTLHCTKFINATALFHPVCSCGEMVDLEDSNFYGHHMYRNGVSECKTYAAAHPSFPTFVCQRCMKMALGGQTNNPNFKCDRFQCPAVACTHHAGQQAYVAELTRRRQMLLPDRRTG